MSKGLNAVEDVDRPLGDWALLRSFIAIFEQGSLSKAAVTLGSTQPSMGRHLRDLERQFGETLFRRLPGKLQATRRAIELYEVLAPMALAAREAGQRLKGHRRSASGMVRIAVSEVLAVHCMPGLVGPLLRDQPNLEIELAVSNRIDNLLRRDADIAIRFVRPEQPDIITRKVGSVQFGLFAHIDYLKNAEVCDLDLSTFGGVVAGFDREQVPRSAMSKGVFPDVTPRFRLRTDAALARHAMIESGFAVGVMPVDLARKNAALRRVLEKQFAFDQEVWLCAHDELHRSTRMQVVWERLITWLEPRFAAAQSIF